MKFRLIIAIALCAMLAFGSVAVAAEQPITAITVDGSKLDTKLAPVVKNGTTYVPMIPYFKALDATVAYDAKTKKATGKRGTKSFSLTIGSKSAKANGKAVSLSQPPILVGKDVYVPYEAGKPLLGAEIEKDAKKKTINVRGYGIDLTVTTKLAATNDRGAAITLQHRGNLKLKWAYRDDSPYQQYSGYVGPDSTVILQGFGERVVLNADGRQLSIETIEPGRSSMLEARLTSNGYDIAGESNQLGQVWRNVPLYLDNRLAVFPVIYVEGKPDYSNVYVNATIDSSGNLIVLTTDGLASYDMNGKRLWANKSWSAQGNTVSAFGAGLSVQADTNNRIYVQTYEGSVILDANGEALLVTAGYSSSPIIGAGTNILYDGGTYALEDGDLKPKALPYVDGSAGDYVSNDKENTLKRMNVAGTKPLWMYQQPLKERNRGFSLFGSTMVVDGDHNVYISTTGGTVHSLDKDGNLRFVLNIDNGTISSTQIVPLSPTAFVAVDNGQVLYFEVTK